MLGTIGVLEAKTKHSVHPDVAEPHEPEDQKTSLELVRRQDPSSHEPRGKRGVAPRRRAPRPWPAEIAEAKSVRKEEHHRAHTDHHDLCAGPESGAQAPHTNWHLPAGASAGEHRQPRHQTAWPPTPSRWRWNHRLRHGLRGHLRIPYGDHPKSCPSGSEGRRRSSDRAAGTRLVPGFGDHDHRCVMICAIQPASAAGSGKSGSRSPMMTMAGADTSINRASAGRDGSGCERERLGVPRTTETRHHRLPGPRSSGGGRRRAWACRISKKSPSRAEPSPPAAGFAGRHSSCRCERTDRRARGLPPGRAGRQPRVLQLLRPWSSRR